MHEEVTTEMIDGVEQAVVTATYVEGDEGELVDGPASECVAEIVLNDTKVNALVDEDFQLLATIPEGTQVWTDPPSPGGIRVAWRRGCRNASLVRKPAGQAGP